jgi:hypothetical protein
MKITVQLVIESDDGPAIVTEVATLTREALTEATLGLSLAESKTILAGVQEAIVAQQAAAYLRHPAPMQGLSPDRGALAIWHAPAR